MAELGRLLIYEASRDWLPIVSGEIQTPLGVASVEFIDPKEPVMIVPVLRAGLVLVEHAASILPQQNSFPLTCEGALLVFTSAFSSVAPEEYVKRNYANNISEYNTVLGSLNAQRRNFLLRDVYDDMLLDGVQPIRDTFHTLIVGAMKGARLQDALYFMDEMKSTGLMPDTTIYNFIISTCGKNKNSDCAIQVLEEMKRCGVKPRGQTYIALLCACASCGRVDRAYAVVRDMTAAGLGLNKYCYDGLITAFKNREPVTEETTSKIMELVKQSKGWSSVEASSGSEDSGMIGVTEEELHNIPTAEIVQRRYINRRLTVYHTALHACADLGSKEAVETISEMLKQDGYAPDLLCDTSNAVLPTMQEIYGADGYFSKVKEWVN